jgi:putative glutathione S-transferase
MISVATAGRRILAPLPTRRFQYISSFKSHKILTFCRTIMTATTTSDSPTGTNQVVTGAAGVTTDDQTNVAERRAKGEFVRGMSSARHWIEDGGKYPPSDSRYHMYVAYNCPWCHRVLLARALLGLEQAVTVDVLFPNRSSDDEPLGPNLWKFSPEGQMGANKRHTSFPECTVDSVHGKSYVKEIYELAGITDQKSVPILFDKQTNTVVNNESAEIMRMFAVGMKDYHTRPLTLFPDDKTAEITQLNDWIYKELANGSYKAGFSSNQDVYETSYETYFAGLEKLDTILESKKFLTGDDITEADVRLFPVMFRHDPIYYSRFKLNEKYLWEFPNVWRWMGNMVAVEGMEPVSNAGYLAHCKQGYFGRTGNGTIPVGPRGYPECYKNGQWPLVKGNKN